MALTLKQHYRHFLRQQRSAYVKTHDILKENQAIASRLAAASVVPAGAVVAGYCPQGSEADGSLILHHFLKKNHLCALPVTESHERILQFRAWRPGMALVKGKYDILMPDASSPLVTPAVLAVPLIGFDLNGNRLGQGAGYYDRTVSRLRTAGRVIMLGIAFDCQEVDNLPCEKHDEPLDYIITPTRMISIRT